MKKASIIFFSLLLLVILGCSENKIKAEMPDGVLPIAELGFRTVRANIKSDPTLWGIPADDNLSKLSLGEGLYVHYIGRKLDNSDGKSILALETKEFSDTWMFTVDYNGKTKVFIPVGFHEGEYEVPGLAMGFSSSAEAFGEARDRIKQLIDDQDEGYDRDLTLMCAGLDYYFVVVKDGKEYVLPVITATTPEELRADQLFPASDVIKYLQKIQQNNRS